MPTVIPGLGKVVRELEALKAEQDAAAEIAFAAMIAAAGLPVYVHKADPLIQWFLHSKVFPCFSFGVLFCDYRQGFREMSY